MTNEELFENVVTQVHKQTRGSGDGAAILVVLLEALAMFRRRRRDMDRNIVCELSTLLDFYMVSGNP